MISFVCDVQCTSTCIYMYIHMYVRDYSLISRDCIGMEGLSLVSRYGEHVPVHEHVYTMYIYIMCIHVPIHV